MAFGLVLARDLLGDGLIELGGFGTMGDGRGMSDMEWTCLSVVDIVGGIDLISEVDEWRVVGCKEGQ